MGAAAPLTTPVTAPDDHSRADPATQPTGIDLVCFRWAGHDLALPAACIIGLDAAEADAPIPDPGTWLGLPPAATPGARWRRLRLTGTLPAALAAAADTVDRRGAGDHRPATPGERGGPTSPAGTPDPAGTGSGAAVVGWHLRVEEPVVARHLPARAIHPLPPLLAARLDLPHLRALALTPPPVRLLLILVPDTP